MIFFKGSLELTVGWARNVLKSNQWSKRKGTNWKIKLSEQSIREEILTFQKRISNVTDDYDIPIDLIVVLDQTPLSYASPHKYTVNPSGAKTVPNSQITAMFAVTMTCKSLPVQVIYEAKIHKYLPNFESLDILI